MKYLLGVELKGNQIKIAAFKKSKQLLELVRLETFNLPPDLNEAAKELTNWISRVLPEPTSIRAVLTISESALYIREMKFPKMEEKKLNEAVYWEIPSIAPIPQSDAVYDMQIVSDNKGMQNVLVIVGKNSYVQNIIQTFRNAQIDVVAIEPSSYAFARIANAPFDTNTLLCLAEEQGMDFIILKDGLPFFTTSVTGNTQSEKITRIKSGTDLMAEIQAEGNKIISYWEKKESLKIFQVVVAGDLVYKYLGLSTALNLFPPTPTYVGTIKTIKSLKTGEYKESELVSYLISIGAAIRHQQKDVLEGVNLFPAAEKKQTENIQAKRKATTQLLTFLYANIAIITLLSASIIALNIWWYSLEKKAEKLSVTYSNHPANSLVQKVNDTNQAVKDIISLAEQQEDTGSKLKLISELVPQSIKLTSINQMRAKTQEWTIEGTGDRDSILAFYKKMSQNINDVDITMPYSNFDKNSDNEFLITLVW